VVGDKRLYGFVLLAGERGKEDTTCLQSLSGDRDSTSRHTPGRQDSFEPTSPGPDIPVIGTR